MHISRTACIVTAIVFVLILASGCSGSDHPQPVMPRSQDYEIPAMSENSVPDTLQWGTWIIRLTDATADSPASAEAVPLRSGEVHVNVTGLLQAPKCTNCMAIAIEAIEGLDWTLLITLTNPSIYTAYDAMGIFPGPDGPSVLQPDSYTDLYDVDGDPSTHNPYMVFDTGNENNAWLPIESHSKLITFHKEDGQKFTEIIYVACASWPENIAEIAELKNPEVTGPLYTDTSNTIDIDVEVVDWQDDIEYVVMDMSALNGSAYTHLEPVGDGIYRLYSYTAYALSPGTANLMIAAKSLGSDFLTYNYVSVEVTDPPTQSSSFAVLSGPTALTGLGAPSGEMDIAVAGKPDGTSFTFVYASDTQAWFWNTDYTSSGLFVTLVDTTGVDPDFPVSPVERIAVTDPTVPLSLSIYSLLQTNGDADVWNDETDPSILFRNTLQTLDMEMAQIVNFTLLADNIETPELDSILVPIDVSSGVGNDKFGYALWAPDSGAYPIYYPYVTLVKYEPPYMESMTEYDTVIGGIQEGTGTGKVDSIAVNGVSVWDGNGEGDLLIFVTEGDPVNEVELYSGNFTANPGGLFTPVTTLTGLPGEPLDVAILPVGDAGLENENWFCVLTELKSVEVYTFSGEFVESVYNIEAFPDTVLHMDTDIENMRIHVVMEGPKVTVVEYTGEG